MAERYARLARALREQPWAIEPAMLEAIVEVLELRISGRELAAEEIAARIGDRERPAAYAAVGAVAVLSLHGVISQRMNLFAEISGGTSTELFGQHFDQAVAAADVGAIVLSIDSPGGSVAGVEELAQKIFRARSAKPIVAVADSQASSAAYWIAAQAHEFVASPSASVGSIGVVTSHRDVSKAEETMGVKTTVIAIPAAKVDGHPYAPLSAEALDGVLASMQPYYDLFVKAVARGRGVAASAVKDGYAQGRVLAAVPAKAAGMVDRIESLADVVARLQTPQGRRAVLQAQASTVTQTPPAASDRDRLWRELVLAELDSL